VRHLRAAPVRHEVHQRTYQWFVDVDRLPQLPWLLRPLARFEARDHAGDPHRSIRANVEQFLDQHGIDLGGGRITMLTNARSLGYVFNPLTLYWCHVPDGTVVAVVAEVHNTYGQRHRYLVRPDDAGRAETAKQFYVSPFYPVDGYYRMSVPEPGERLAVTITLHRPDDRPFTASIRGTRRVASSPVLLRTALQHPFATVRVRTQIARHGVALYRKGLRVVPRPPTTKGTAMTSTAARLAAALHDIAGVDLPIRLRAWDGSEAGPDTGPTVVLRRRRALRRVIWSPGELGLARAYVTGDLDVEGDLASGFRQVWAAARSASSGRPRLTARGRLRAIRAAVGLGILGPPPIPPAAEARLHGRVHTRRRDRQAIAHHYDLSNDFYSLLLDESMAYSAAYFAAPDQSLADAQRAKLDLICRKLGLRPGQRLLDVGCGWGSLILHAAEHYGVEAVGVTLSARQRDFVAKRAADRGLTDRAAVRLGDYRELPDIGAAGTFDAVSSIEMGEHVGEGHYPTYAGTLFAMLKPTGRLVLQQMSRRQDAAPGGGAFIESYIAPDMHMRPLARTIGYLEQVGFEVRDVEGMREHYVRTVAAWTDTFERRYQQVVDLVGEEVARVWRLYLVGGALSFEEGRMGVDQILAVKPTTTGLSGLPAGRSWVINVNP
jgi:cyclopropane fatty-acyl-phospholipid synthase-like methyltransferase/DUF1365 family protein